MEKKSHVSAVIAIVALLVVVLGVGIAMFVNAEKKMEAKAVPATMMPAPADTVVPVATAPTPAPEVPKMLGVHTVVPKDTLWHISDKWYADPVLWPAIYEINKDQISDPDLIFPGQKFDIPALKTDGNLSPEDKTLLTQGYLEAYRVYKEKGKNDAEDYKTEAGNYSK